MFNFCSYAGIFDPVSIAEKSASPSDTLCYGYQNTDTEGCYITTCKLEIGLVDKAKLEEDETLLHIASYDTAEANGACIGQINMIYVSSFSGPCAAVWGYDLAAPDDLRKKKWFTAPENKEDLLKDDFSVDAPGIIPVYDITPLLNATESLYGTVADPHFPIIPGAHVPCAAKEGYSADAVGTPEPGWIWCFLSLAIAENRSKDACLFVEDTGFFSDVTGPKLNKDQVIEQLDKKRREVVYTQLLCGENQKVPYKEIFIGYKYEYVHQHNYGCALTCAPYVTLAKNAYPGGNPKNLHAMNLKTWEKSVLRGKK